VPVGNRCLDAMDTAILPSASPDDGPPHSSRPQHGEATADGLSGDLPHRASLARWLTALLVLSALSIGVYYSVLRWQLADDSQAAARRLDFYAAALDTELTRYESLPAVMALQPALIAAVQGDRSTDHVAAANAYLVDAQRRTQVDVAYLLDRSGTTIAASNHASNDSFVGHNYAFRPYASSALQGKLGRYYAIGTTTGRAGYFLAAPVFAGTGAPQGVVVIKVSLEAFEVSMRRSGDRTLLLDANGVAFLSAVPEWRFHTLRPLTVETRAGIELERQYEGEALPPLATVRGWVVATRRAQAQQRAPYVGHAVGQLGWQLIGIPPEGDAARTAVLAAAATALAGFAALASWQYHRQRRHRRHELRERESEIRRRIATSTQHLQSQIEAQARSEALLRRTQDSAVQGGKLAVLGQMAAGISHELNQPLTAMTSYADNALRLMEAGERERVLGNLHRIIELADRMGLIVGHLRAHARKQPEPLRPVELRAAVDSAMALVRLQGIAQPPTDNQIDDGVAVHADPVRLEQVLVNLIRNALDAVAAQLKNVQPAEAPTQTAAVWIRAERRGETVEISVHDGGAGIAADAMKTLFEPFSTTKPAGHGLGLGLAVSRMIVEGMGGTLAGANKPAGGAVFTVTLQAAVATEGPERGTD